MIFMSDDHDIYLFFWENTVVYLVYYYYWLTKLEQIQSISSNQIRLEPVFVAKEQVSVKSE